MINKITNILSRPYFIPGKIVNIIRFNKFKKNYNFKTYEDDQNIKFNQLGLDREKGIFNLSQILKWRKQSVKYFPQVIPLIWLEMR